MTLCALLAAVSMALSAEPLPPDTAPRPPVPADIDTERLPKLLERRGFKPPEGFKALVVRLDREPGGSWTQSRYDWRGTSVHRENWWPASTVKLYAAIAALEVLHALGLPPQAKATFAYEDEPRSNRISSLLHSALVPSNNLAYDRLVELVGFDTLNGEFFTAAKGFHDTVLLRAYFGRFKNPETGNATNRVSPAITLSYRKQSASLPAREGKGELACPEEGNCTSLRDLAEALKRTILHFELPETQRFAFGKQAVATLERLLKKERKRGNGVVDGLREAFGESATLYHKAGFARDWFSDAVFVKRRGRTHYIVAMAGYGGRDVLDDASRRVGKLLRAGAFPKIAAAQATKQPVSESSGKR